MMRTMAQTGRPSKGDRVVTYARPARAVRVALEKDAAAAGYDNLSDYISKILAEHVDLAHLAPGPARHPDQEALPVGA